MAAVPIQDWQQSFPARDLTTGTAAMRLGLTHSRGRGVAFIPVACRATLQRSLVSRRNRSFFRLMSVARLIQRCATVQHFRSRQELDLAWYRIAKNESGRLTLFVLKVSQVV